MMISLMQCFLLLFVILLLFGNITNILKDINKIFCRSKKINKY
jgi:Sec-independent protein translocase protein TatA